MSEDLKRLAAHYAQRDLLAERYSPLRPEVWQTVQERQRALIRLLRDHAPAPLNELRAAEVGCGAGGNLLELMQLGFAPQHLMGLELLPERLTLARERLPAAVQLLAGDATQAAIEASSQDLVLAYTVFSSLLDDALQARLAEAMWRWLKPGGAVLWYDFVFDNPANREVRGVPLRRVRELFPAASTIEARRVTLAPPLARRLCRLHPSLYPLANGLPLLRTHRLAWIQKPSP